MRETDRCRGQSSRLVGRPGSATGWLGVGHAWKLHHYADLHAGGLQWSRAKGRIRLVIACPRPDYDQALKRLLARSHDGFLALLLPEARWLRARSPELPSSPREADLVWEVALASGERVLFHVELQTYPDAQIGERLAEYAIRLWRDEHLPIRSMVIYLQDAGHVADPPFSFERGSGQGGLRYHYDVVRLWEVALERVLQTQETGLLPLAPLAAGATEETVVAVAHRIAELSLPRPERAELVGLLAVLAGMRLSRPRVEQLLRRTTMIRDLIRASSFTDVMKDEGKREVVQTMLEGRFGELEQAGLAALEEAQEPVLHEIAAHITTDSREQVRARLGLT